MRQFLAMGGIRKFKNRQKGKKGNRDNNLKGYVAAERKNDNLLEFYRKQKVCQSEEELTLMMEALQRDLNASFRITGFRSQADAVRDLVESEYIAELDHVVNEDVDAEKTNNLSVTCLPWYPDRMGWQLRLSRQAIRKEERLFKLHNFLISETESGNISRQETVSMLPPLVLEVEPHHKVLDMCAAPGSKTAQLIEALHAREGVVPEGLVVANDSDNSRCYMLVHQAKRLQSPCMMVTNHDASIMPNIRVESEGGAINNLKFDRVLCDVPCSGDGTLRKNVDIWPKWNAANSCNLHGLQYRIAKRGLELLAVGGRLVYSTCTMNPVEDEAVVHRLLKEAGSESLELLDVAHLVPGLEFKPGLNTWLVANKENKFFEKFLDVPESNHTLIRPSMFPPEDPGVFQLQRCMRILPHQQDTGGFFVAVLHKKSLCAWEKQVKDEDRSKKVSNEPEPNSELNDNNKRVADNNKVSNNKRRRFQGYREDPFVYLDPEKDSHVFEEIQQFFDIHTLGPDMLLTRSRSEGVKNNLYLTSRLVRSIVRNNDDDRLKIINTGVKAFCKCENKGSGCTYRLAQEGSQMVIPFLRQRIIRPTKRDLELMLTIDDTEKPTAIENLDEETQTQTRKINTGSVALLFEGMPTPQSVSPIRLNLVGWKGNASLRAYVPKNERIHYLRLMRADTSKFEKNKFKVRRGNENQDESKKDEKVEDKSASKNLPEKTSNEDKQDVQIVTSS